MLYNNESNFNGSCARTSFYLGYNPLEAGHTAEGGFFMIKKCEFCGKEFRTFYSVLKNGGGRFCSLSCFGKYFRPFNVNLKNPKKGIYKKCLICNKNFYVRESRSNAKFCSIKCWKLSKRIKIKCKLCKKYFEVTLSRKNRVYCNECKLLRNCRIKKRCEGCGKYFLARKDFVKKGNDRYCSKRCYFLKQKTTNIERKINDELEKRNFLYEKQKYIDNYIIDFYLPKYKIIIEADGDYWHNLPKNKNRDIQRDFILGFKGYKIFRFWEHEINKSSSKCIDEVENYIKEIKKDNFNE